MPQKQIAPGGKGQELIPHSLSADLEGSELLQRLSMFFPVICGNGVF